MSRTPPRFFRARGFLFFPARRHFFARRPVKRVDERRAVHNWLRFVSLVFQSTPPRSGSPSPVLGRGGRGVRARRGFGSMTRYIFVTGGVVSSIGKGITTASLGRLLRNRGFNVTVQKLDPYINVDAGTMNPFQHGEVFVTDDGAETDLDLG